MRISKIAKRYAKALLDIGKEDGNYEQYGHELREFVELCSKNPEFFDILSNPVFSVDERMNIMESILQKTGFSEIVKNFLRVLLERQRIAKIEEISVYYSKLLDDILGIARAKIITARPLKKKTLNKLVKSLEKFISKKVDPEIEVDESIIGGVIVKIGDLVLDGSITAQLRGLKESLKRGEYR